MFDAQSFRDVVSGRRGGPIAATLRGALRMIEFPYACAMRRRNRAFDSGRRAVHRVAAPVVSVGNLTLGGTGKTPMVEWLAQRLASWGVRVALVSRGYKSSAGQLNDEGRELQQKLPDVPHLQDIDRVAAARRAIEQFGAQALVLDDGFQHRRLARELDIVLIDALEPFGFGHVFPRGTLREPLEGLARAQVVVLTRADMIPATQREAIRRQVEQLAPAAVWASCRHAPRRLLSSQGASLPLDSLARQPVAAFCGIGNPAGFRHTLAQCEYKIVDWKVLPDHHAYTPAELSAMGRAAKAAGATAIVCTHKDLVKVDAESLEGLPLWAVGVGMEFLEGEAGVEACLSQHFNATRPINETGSR